MSNREEYIIYNGENYAAWRFATMNYLKSKKIWRTIRGQLEIQLILILPKQKMAKLPLVTQLLMKHGWKSMNKLWVPSGNLLTHNLNLN
jgi:hypothetical protein